MKLTWKKRAGSLALCLVLLCAVLVPTASAHGHPGDTAKALTVSSWAQAEVQKAEALGLTDLAGTELGNDYRQPITRAQFCALALNFVARQEGSDLTSFRQLIEKYKASYDAQGDIQRPFTDVLSGTDDVSLAHYIGLVEGKGNGIFDSQGLLTRQEAAVMLARAYQTYAGAAQAGTDALSFPDADKIADWAQEGVALMAQWKVMNGVEDGSFAPTGSYTIEQCLLTLLRLWENAPVSRAQANVTPMFTYDQALEAAKHPYRNDSLTVAAQIEGPAATFLRMDLGGVMQPMSYLYFVYPDGGLRRVDLGVCTTGYGLLPPSVALQDAAFSADGKTFTCTVTLPEGTKGHEAGTYHITVDVETLAYQTARV